MVTAGAAGATAAAGDAAEDRNEEETAYAGGDTDDEVFVVVDPAADFFGGGGAFALALGGDLVMLFVGKWDREVVVDLHYCICLHLHIRCRRGNFAACCSRLQGRIRERHMTIDSPGYHRRRCRSS